MKYVKEKVVKSCFNSCQFFKTEGHIMMCSHPWFEDKPPYTGLIINQHNSRDGKVPVECPLKKKKTNRNHITN